MSERTNPADLRRCGITALVQALGYADAMRFLLQYETGHGDYTRERDSVLPNWSEQELVAQADQIAQRQSGLKKD